MPVIWILIVGVLLYFILRVLEKHHSETNKKRNAEKPQARVPEEADTPVVTEPAPDKSIEKGPFLDTIAGMPSETKTELMQLNLTTPGAIGAAPDEKLLAVKGIGPARLKQIRAVCADAK